MLEQEGRGPAVSKKKQDESDEKDKKEDKGSDEGKDHTDGDSHKTRIGAKLKGVLHKE